MYLNTRIFPTTGYAGVMLVMFIRRELGGTGTGCLFQFSYCVVWCVERFDRLLPEVAIKSYINTHFSVSQKF